MPHAESTGGMVERMVLGIAKPLSYHVGSLDIACTIGPQGRGLSYTCKYIHVGQNSGKHQTF